MRVTLGSMQAMKDEIKALGFDNITQKLLRYTRANIPKQSQEPFLTFDTFILITFVSGEGDEKTLFEMAHDYGVTLQQSNPDYNNDDQPQNVREKALKELKAWCEKKGLQLRPGKIELF